MRLRKDATLEVERGRLHVAQGGGGRRGRGRDAVLRVRARVRRQPGAEASGERRENGTRSRFKGSRRFLPERGDLAAGDALQHLVRDGQAGHRFRQFLLHLAVRPRHHDQRRLLGGRRGHGQASHFPIVARRRHGAQVLGQTRLAPLHSGSRPAKFRRTLRDQHRHRLAALLDLSVGKIN